jgi:hypothetical protein
MQQATTEVIAALRVKLTEYDQYFIIDASGSMKNPYKAGSSKTRWEHQRETLESAVKFACEVDSDGVGLVIMHGGKILSFENVTYDKLDGILSGLTPEGGTPTAQALETVFAMSEKSDKKDFVNVFTDGEPNNEQAVIDVIVAKTKRMQKDNDCTVLFYQIGDDVDCTKHLKNLDDNLVSKHGAKFDMVDTKTISEINQFGSFEEIQANAIVD